MFCIKCGHKLIEGNDKCSNCGNSVIDQDICGGFWGLVGTDPEIVKSQKDDNPVDKNNNMLTDKESENIIKKDSINIPSNAPETKSIIPYILLAVMTIFACGLLIYCCLLKNKIGTLEAELDHRTNISATAGDADKNEKKNEKGIKDSDIKNNEDIDFITEETQERNIDNTESDYMSNGDADINTTTADQEDR
jgi:hypothetical protein